MPALYQTPTRRSRAPLATQREVTPNQGNKRSPDSAVDAQIVKDVDSSNSNRREDFTFVWREDLPKER